MSIYKHAHTLLLALTVIILGSTTLFFMKKSPGSKAKIARLHVISNITNVDPANINDLYEAWFISKVYEPVLCYDFQNKIVPLLLKEMPQISKNRRVITLKLKENLKFPKDACLPNGRKITAHDLAYSLTRLFHSKHNCKTLNFISHIKGGKAFRQASKQNPNTPYKIEGIQIVDKYTLRIELDEPIEILSALAMPFTSIVCKEAVEHYGDRFKYHPVSPAPWKLNNDLNPRSKKFILKRNPDYHGTFPKITSSKYAHMKKYEGKKLPLLDELHIDVIQQANSSWLKFKKGDLDVYLWPNAELYGSYLTKDGKPGEWLKKNKIKVLPNVPVSLSFIHLNLNLKHMTKKVRQAIALAIDLNRIKDRVYDGNGSVPQGVLLPGFETQGYDVKYTSPYAGKCDVEKAKTLLDQAGYPGGKGFPTFVLYIGSGRNTHIKTAQCIKEDLGKLGIQVRIQSMPFSDLLSAVKKPGATYWSGCAIGWGLDNLFMDNMLQVWYGKNAGGNNTSFYINELFDRIFEEAIVLPLSPQKVQKYQRLNEIVGEDVPCIPIHMPQNYSLWRKHVKNGLPQNVMIFGREKYLDIEE